jgi:hypothetical protein
MRTDEAGEHTPAEEGETRDRVVTNGSDAYAHHRGLCRCFEGGNHKQLVVVQPTMPFRSAVFLGFWPRASLGLVVGS